MELCSQHKNTDTHLCEQKWGRFPFHIGQIGNGRHFGDMVTGATFGGGGDDGSV